MTNKKMNGKMKYLIMGAFALISSTSFAQNWGSDSLACRQNVALYSDFLGKKEYKSAAQFWQKTLEVCPEYKPLLYTNGAYIYGKLAKAEENDSLKKAYTDTVFFAHEKLIEIFGNTPEAKQGFGIDLMKHDPKNQYEKANLLLKEAIDALGKKTKSSTLQYYYKSAYYMYKYKKVDEAHMVNEYFKVLDVTSNEKVENYVTKIAEPFLKCEDLVPSLTKKFEENSEDASELKKILALLEKRKCYDGDLFQNASVKLLELEPSADGYYSYAVLMFEKEKDAEAIKSINQALEMCGDCDSKLKYTKTAAQIHSGAGKATKAYNLAKQWLELDPNAGGAYLIMSRSVASSASSCANDAFEKGIVHIIASDLASKAKSIDESVSSSANKMISGYKKQFPTKSDVVFKGVSAGDSYTINCWLNKSTTIRTRD